MPTEFTLLSWNIKDLSSDQVDDDDFMELMATVIRKEKAQLVSILETKADRGKDVKATLVKKLGGKWKGASSAGSAPKGNKPEYYVLLWDGAAITKGDDFKFPDGQSGLGFPKTHNANKSPSRFPYLGRFTAGTTTFRLVAFHTTFASVDIAEANQRLADIAEVKSEANVIVAGDFNDPPTGGRTYKGKTSWDPLRADTFKEQITGKTSLCQAFDSSWASTADCRASVYDNFWIKGAITVTGAGEVVDLVKALQQGNYLETLGRKVFNNWATRTNAYEKTPARVKERARKKRPAWVDVVLFGTTDHIVSIEDAHEVHWVCVSDHLPIKIRLEVA